MTITRVTQTMLTNQSIYAVDSNLSKMSQDQEVLNTGKRINVPSDDPTGTSTALQASAGLANQAQYQSNATDGLAWLTTIDSSLKNVNSNATRAYTLALDGANTGTNTSTSETALADEIDQIKAAVFAASNSAYLGRPVYGGTTTNGQAYAVAGSWTDSAGNPVPPPTQQQLAGAGYAVTVGSSGVSLTTGGTPTTQPDGTVTVSGGTTTALPDGSAPVAMTIGGTAYQFSANTQASASGLSTQIVYTGDDGTVSRRVGADTLVAVNTSGASAFGDDGTDNPNIFTTLSNLSSALRTSDTNGIEAGIASLRQYMSNVSSAQANEGARYNQITGAQTVAQNQTLALTATKSNAQDADLAQATIALQTQSTAYQAALAATAKTVQPSLLDFLS